MADDEFVLELKNSIEEERNKFPQLMRRIKNGKRWLTENRLEILQFNNMERDYDFKRWMGNLETYWDLAEEAYKKMLITAEEIDLFHPLFIEDFYPTLKKIFPEKRLKDALDI